MVHREDAAGAILGDFRKFSYFFSILVLEGDLGCISGVFFGVRRLCILYGERMTPKIE